MCNLFCERLFDEFSIGKKKKKKATIWVLFACGDYMMFFQRREGVGSNEYGKKFFTLSRNHGTTAQKLMISLMYNHKRKKVFKKAMMVD